MLQSTAQAYAALAGLWQICAGAGRTFATAPADTIGVEFTVNSADPSEVTGGNMYYLVQGASGPVRGAGYSPCPREFQISGGSVSPDDRAILVPF